MYAHIQYNTVYLKIHLDCKYFDWLLLLKKKKGTWMLIFYTMSCIRTYLYVMFKLMESKKRSSLFIKTLPLFKQNMFFLTSFMQSSLLYLEIQGWLMLLYIPSRTRRTLALTDLTEILKINSLKIKITKINGNGLLVYIANKKMLNIALDSPILKISSKKISFT